MKQILKITFLLVIAIATSCTEDPTETTYDGDSLVGKWDVQNLYVFYHSDVGFDTMYNQSCEFVFNNSGTVYRYCVTFQDTLDWYFRESPPKVILLDEDLVFSNISTYDVLNFEDDFQEWEYFEEGEFGTVDIDTISHYRNYMMHRK